MARVLREKIVDLAKLLPILAERRRRGERVVQCHGCFDVVHPGHIRHLADASGHGDVLLVSVTADDQVNKGIGRPFVPQELRCENLAALSMVDFVVVSPESWAGPVLDQVKPDVYVKGLEYSTNNDPRFLKEKEIVERHGGVVVYTSGEVVYSSTRLQQEQLDQEDAALERLSAILSRYGLSRSSLERRLHQFAGIPVAVVGDALLDHYVECEQTGVTAEAPVLGVSPIDERYYVGGACVLALHAAALGANPAYIGFLPPAAGSPVDIAGTLDSKRIRVYPIPTEHRLIKTRYLVEGQKVFKVDRCRPLSISSAEEKMWLSHVRTAAGGGSKGLIAVDFGYGSLSRPRMAEANRIVRTSSGLLFADTSSSRYASLSKFSGLGCDVAFPNEAEVRAYLGEPQLGLPLLASRLFDDGMAQVLALTLGARGLVLFDRRRLSTDADGGVRYLPEYLPAFSRYCVDPLGAGDALSAVGSLTLLAGGDPVEAAVLGSIAAAIVVRRLGNDPVTTDAMIRFMNHHPLFAE